MEEIRTNNYVMLRGVLASKPQLSHENRGESFYQFSAKIQRLSGAADIINVIARQELIKNAEIDSGSMLCVYGSLRSFNSKSGVGQKLIISVFAKDIWFDSGEDENTVELIGTICKAPSLRVTPMGREICDLMLAVNRHYGRSDYLPCIAWGLKAREASQWEVGTVISLAGRIQSRNYTKTIGLEMVEKTAYEVSVISLAKYEERSQAEIT